MKDRKRLQELENRVKAIWYSFQKMQAQKRKNNKSEDF